MIKQARDYINRRQNKEMMVILYAQTFTYYKKIFVSFKY